MDVKRNGIPVKPFKVSLDRIEGSLYEIKDDLSAAIRAQTVVVRELSSAVAHLTQQISLWDRSVPIKLVVIMFSVVVCTVGSIEAIKAYIKIALGG